MVGSTTGDIWKDEKVGKLQTERGGKSTMTKKIKKSKRKLAKGANLKRFSPTKLDLIKDFIESGKRDLWLVQGANYLNSDLLRGLWSPLQDIYAGQEPNVSQLIKEVSARYQIAEKEWEEKGVVLLSWIYQKPQQMYDLYQAAIKITDVNRVWMPEDEDIWNIFESARELVLNSLHEV